MSPDEYARALEPLLAQAAGYARALLRNRQDAEDAVQDAALRGWQRIASYERDRPFKGWWFAILRNRCIDMQRRARLRTTRPLLEEHVLQPVREEREDWEELASAISSASEIHREILNLRYFADLSYAEIAEALNIPKGTVMSRLHLARKALAEQIERRRV